MHVLSDLSNFFSVVHSNIDLNCDIADQRMCFDGSLTVAALNKVGLMADSRVCVAFVHLWFGVLQGKHGRISNQ